MNMPYGPAIRLPVDVFDVTATIEEMLVSDVALSERKVTVVNAEDLNQDPDRCPWLGIYRTGVRYPPRALGLGAGYRENRVGLVIVAQEADPESGRAASERLEKHLIKHVIRILLNDQSLGGHFDTLDEFEVVYNRYGLQQNSFMQQALIHFVGLTNVR